MSDPLIARFADACGATGPLDLRVGDAGGGVLAEGSVHQPFSLVGSDDACDVTLSDPQVNPRHAWLQVVGGRVHALDLGSRTGLVWPDGGSRSGWLDAGTPVRVGTFYLTLRGPISTRHPEDSPSPLAGDPDIVPGRPLVQLDFRNGRRARDRWAVNRVITLVGRAEECKLCLHADDIAAYHCGLVLTPDGLWVVDLSGRGVVVNGERMRVAPLPHGAELWVGRFLIGCHYPAAGDVRAVARLGPAPAAGTPGPQPPRAPDPVATPTQETPILPVIAEDEVPLGGMPTLDPLSGLPSSHILCDAFRAPPSSGAHSSPILVSASTAGAVPYPPRPQPAPPAAPHPPAATEPPVPAAASPVAPLLQHLGDIQDQLFDQYRQSLEVMARVYAQLHPGEAAAVQREVARVQELNEELVRLQAEVTRMALSQAIGTSQSRPADPAPGRRSVSDVTPIPDRPFFPGGHRTPDTAEAIMDWVQERIAALQKERNARWEKLFGRFAACTVS